MEFKFKKSMIIEILVSVQRPSHHKVGSIGIYAKLENGEMIRIGFFSLGWGEWCGMEEEKDKSEKKFWENLYKGFIGNEIEYRTYEKILGTIVETWIFRDHH